MDSFFHLAHQFISSLVHLSIVLLYNLAMEPVNPPVINPATPTSTPAQEPKKGSPLAIIAVAIFTLLALAAVAFLYYQNQQLKGMLTNYQVQITPTPITTPTPNANEPIVSSPSANMKVVSPLKVTGTVPTGWMFEGVFPIKLLDSNDKVLAQGQGKEVTAGSWQSGKPVDFTATLVFKAATGSGTLVLSNDNPSGDPTKAQTFEVPVSF